MTAEQFRLHQAVWFLAFAELEGDQCRCGKAKLPRRAFCGPCYQSLPVEMRKPLYDRHRFPKAYLLALHHLGLVVKSKFVAAIAALEA